ncbi:trans-sulfuration enzyme family protein [Tenacibaculum amylolyticum]|uniref:trans-sulfuration enzyme family protein n=1 Tax=Tenacibaculum amylolyticum TaxID=104269 RepID=UPI0038930810
MNIDTQLTHLGRASAKSMQSVNPPITKTSTVVFPDLHSFESSKTKTVFENIRYGRYGTQITFELQQAMAKIECTETCIATASGMSAIVAVLSSYAELGKHILVSEGVYKSTKAFCETKLAKSGIEITFFNKNDHIENLITPETSLVYIEVPSSTNMQLLDIKSVCKAAHGKGIVVACDATWGTPIFFKPHLLGIDISIHSATKYINGHSDIILGLITGTDEKMMPVRDWCYRYGSYAASDSCWLALRGLRTLSIRMKQHQENAMIVANWLRSQPEVTNVIYPPFFTGIDLELWKTQFSGAAGPFKVELQPCQDHNFEQFINSLDLFSIGASYGGFSSVVTPTNQTKQESSINKKRIVRFHIGLENPYDLCDDIRKALQYLSI